MCVWLLQSQLTVSLLPSQLGQIRHVGLTFFRRSDHKRTANALYETHYGTDPGMEYESQPLPQNVRPVV